MYWLMLIILSSFMLFQNNQVNDMNDMIFWGFCLLFEAIMYAGEEIKDTIRKGNK